MPAKRGVEVDHGWSDRSYDKSNHGAQRGDSVALAIGWACDVNPDQYVARFGVSYTAKGKGRGKGLRLIDASKQHDGRTDGTDWLSIKAPVRRKGDGGWTVSHELFTGLPETWEVLAAALCRAAAEEKRVGIVVVHCENTGDEHRDTFNPIPVEVGAGDLARMYVEACKSGIDQTHKYASLWNKGTFAGIPVKPDGYFKGRAGNPCGMWASEPDKETGYITVSFSMNRTGMPMRACAGWGDVAAAVDAAVAPRKR
jgi:hypothetical protein